MCSSSDTYLLKCTHLHSLDLFSTEFFICPSRQSCNVYKGMFLLHSALCLSSAISVQYHLLSIQDDTAWILHSELHRITNKSLKSSRDFRPTSLNS
jgi:hypothetical protein